MAIKGKQFDLQTVKAVDDANIFKFFSDGVLRGCAVTYTSSTITIAAGYLIAAGREIQIDSAYTITPADIIANGYVRIKLKIDLSQTASATSFTQGSIIYDYSTTTTFTDLVQGDINGGGDTVYEIKLAVGLIESGSITGIVNFIGASYLDAARLGGQLPSYYAKASDGMPYGGVISNAVLDSIVTRGHYYVSGGAAPAAGFATNSTLLVFVTGERIVQQLFGIDGQFATRVKPGTSAWTKWSVVPGARQGTVLDASSNANLILQSGVYQAAGVTSANGFVHTYAVFEVYNVGSYVLQRSTATTGDVKTRIYTGSSWTAWA